ncbi:MAG: hypothetical protein K1V81_00670 [Paramuribaculum sp.]|jgi:hypothetical protein
MGESTKFSRTTAVMVATVILTLIIAGATAYFYGRSLVSFTGSVVPCIAVGFAASYFLIGIGRRLSGSDSFIANYLFQGAFLSAVACFIFLGGNYTFGSYNTHKEEAVVERLYTKTEHRTKRVGRRYVRTGEPYKVYYIELSFGNGKKKSIRLGQKGFCGHKKGEKLDLELAEGIFGIPVIKSGI